MTKMTEATKVRLRQYAARRVVVRKLEAVDWHAACDWADESPERSNPEDERRLIARGFMLRGPSRLPPLAVEVLRSRLPHTMTTLSAGPYAQRTVPVFYWPTLKIVYSFLGILALRHGQLARWKLVTGTIRFRKRCLPRTVVDPREPQP